LTCSGSARLAALQTTQGCSARLAGKRTARTVDSGCAGLLSCSTCGSLAFSNKVTINSNNSDEQVLVNLLVSGSVWVLRAISLHELFAATRDSFNQVVARTIGACCDILSVGQDLLAARRIRILQVALLLQVLEGF
jgi:hypothetical protein